MLIYNSLPSYDSDFPTKIFSLLFLMFACMLLDYKQNTDLKPYFRNKYLHFRDHFNIIDFGAPNTIQNMCAYRKQIKFVFIYYYIDISLETLLCTPISNCSPAKLFLALKTVRS